MFKILAGIVICIGYNATTDIMNVNASYIALTIATALIVAGLDTIFHKI